MKSEFKEKQEGSEKSRVKRKKKKGYDIIKMGETNMNKQRDK